MNYDLLTDLSYLFSLEALEADRRGDDTEGDRLWDISGVLHARAESVRHHELVAALPA